MEFDEIKKVWDTQNNAPMYVINEKAMRNRILSKKNQAGYVAGFTELLLILANTVSGIFVLMMDLSREKVNIYVYMLASWMLATALYVLFGRIRRIKENNRFDRSIRGDLAHAISSATYQVRLSQLMRWNVIPVAMLIFLVIREGGKSVMAAAGILVFFVLVHYASRWEHNIYKVRKRELEALKNKLESDSPEETS